MKLKKSKSFVLAAIAAFSMILASCVSTDADGTDPAISRGINAWNSRSPEAAAAYWSDIEDEKVQKKYLNYITLYKAGVEALDSTDSIKASNESKLLSACNTAIAKFNALDPALELEKDVCDKGATLAAGRIAKLLESEKVSEAKKMYSSASKLFGTNDDLAAVSKQVDVVNAIATRKTKLKDKLAKANEVEDLDQKIKEFNDLVSYYQTLEGEVSSEVKKSGLASVTSVANAQRSFKKLGQDVTVQREGAIREKAYDYKERIGEVFARQPEGTGSGKNGTFTLEEILGHYKSVQTDMDVVFNELLEFREKYPKEIGQDVIDDINAQKADLNSKIAQVNKEIATEKEIASRGKTVMPLMIGLFNPEAGTSGDNKKSRPAKFSAKNATKDEYWWGMVSIPKGQMNDLVITMKDNRTVRVFNENTKSGKLIEKNNLQDLVNRGSKVGNSWPVLNAGAQLKGSNYFFEVQKGKTDSYSGEVVVYSSFITRMR